MSTLLSSCVSVDSPSRQDEEHKLIARYTSRLAETDGTGVSRQDEEVVLNTNG